MCKTTHHKRMKREIYSTIKSINKNWDPRKAKNYTHTIMFGWKPCEVVYDVDEDE
jgi:hypothetical protein